MSARVVIPRDYIEYLKTKGTPQEVINYGVGNEVLNQVLHCFGNEPVSFSITSPELVNKRFIVFQGFEYLWRDILSFVHEYFEKHYRAEHSAAIQFTLVSLSTVS